MELTFSNMWSHLADTKASSQENISEDLGV